MQMVVICLFLKLWWFLDNLEHRRWPPLNLLFDDENDEPCLIKIQKFVLLLDTFIKKMANFFLLTKQQKSEKME